MSTIQFIPIRLIGQKISLDGIFPPIKTGMQHKDARDEIIEKLIIQLQSNVPNYSNLDLNETAKALSDHQEKSHQLQVQVRTNDLFFSN
jgi:hypothetical protein